MKQSLSLNSKRRILIGVAAALVGVSAFYFFVAEAVSVQAVGQLYVKFVPNAGDAGTEYVDVNYTGNGVADLSGWSIRSNSNGQVYDLSGVRLAHNESWRVCEEGAVDTRCNDNWQRNDVFADDGDTMVLKDDYGSNALELQYTNVGSGEVEEGPAPYVTDVYGKKDKLTLCHADNNKASYTLRDASVNALVQSFEKDNNNHAGHPEDVIPSFFYRDGSSIDYYAGVNWPEERVFFENGCQ